MSIKSDQIAGVIVISVCRRFVVSSQVVDRPQDDNKAVVIINVSSTRLATATFCTT